MKRKSLTVEDRLRSYRRKFYITLTILALLVGLFGFYIYLNYDYLVFKHFIAHNYIYTDALDSVFEKELKMDVKGRYYTYFDNLAISSITKRIREENNDKYTYLFIPEYYKEYLQVEKEDAMKSEIKVLNDNTIYLRLTNFSKYTKKFVKDNIKELETYPFIILDLRDNYGGDISVMNSIASLFLPQGSTIATDKMRLFNWTYRAKKGQTLDYEKIVILQNGSSASSSENLIAALKDNLGNVILIGTPTFGKGIGQYTLPLKKGFAVKATTLLWYTPNNINIQGKGINPDIPYTGEDIIDFSIKKLQE